MTAAAKLPSVFRESFIRLFECPEVQAALRLLDQTLYTAALEVMSPGNPPWLQSEASGALGDLRQAIDSITDLSRWVDEASLNREEARLALVAGDVAAELEAFAGRLDAALADYIADSQAEAEAEAEAL